MTLDPNTRVMDLPLSARLKHSLFNCGDFRTLGEVVDFLQDYGEEKLLRTPNLGKVSLAELKAFLESNALLDPSHVPDDFIEWCLKNRRALMLLRQGCN